MSWRGPLPLWQPKRITELGAHRCGLRLGVGPLLTSSNAKIELTVMISGGFALAYQAAVPDFARATGIVVQTLSGASQGQGPTLPLRAFPRE